jgi:hypothetical protein
VQAKPLVVGGITMKIPSKQWDKLHLIWSRGLIFGLVCLFVGLGGVVVDGAFNTVEAGQVDGRWSDDDGNNYKCPPYCGDSGSGSGSGGSEAYEKGAAFGRELREKIKRLFGPSEKRLQQEEYDKHAEEKWGPFVEELIREGMQSQKQLESDIQQTKQAQAIRLADAGRSHDLMNHWNDAGFEAYHRSEWGKSLRYLRTAQQYAPDNPDIKHNSENAQKKVVEKAEKYFHSLKTALGIVNLTPHLLILHPNPYVRMEAHKALARDTMKTVAEAAAEFILSEHLNRQKLQPFKWQSEKEKSLRKQEAMRHSKYVAELFVKASAEAQYKYQKLDLSKHQSDKPISILPEKAMSQLIEISFYGFK